MQTLIVIGIGSNIGDHDAQLLAEVSKTNKLIINEHKEPMSDTSVISTISSNENFKVKRKYTSQENSSCCARYWFIMITSVLSLFLVIASVLLAYTLNKQVEREQKRQFIKNEFKRKHHVTNKVLDKIMKDGFVYKWIKAQKGSIATTFQELFTDISETLFDS
ncbi:unnamed protein product [Rotaria magnacalcarata]|uniref:Uncharacterized protein n=2 Tax=Rotaria magnacalcarata TaxID=392030 RepID=A0A816Z0A4_9BILA|nr:unnamed protein product [Rotaria magnacalcarata]CAF2187223.1 unnamed protein product [Rotaria magnacalcarata]CAF2243425.1 unnamed protein product [Rotaria magnacalcarata]CAF3785623.1 unnamed protein product [Rotaria magnacalcarata]CAF3800000.1 unnamed protein product [Rotaria magnacalcarata]